MALAHLLQCGKMGNFKLSTITSLFAILQPYSKKWNSSYLFFFSFSPDDIKGCFVLVL